jgi:hypothetical protein
VLAKGIETVVGPAKEVKNTIGETEESVATCPAGSQVVGGGAVQPSNQAAKEGIGIAIAESGPTPETKPTGWKVLARMVTGEEKFGESITPPIKTKNAAGKVQAFVICAS